MGSKSCVFQFRTAEICSLPKKRCFRTLLTHSKDFKLQLTHWSVGSRNEDFSQEGGGGSKRARESQLAGDSLRCVDDEPSGASLSVRAFEVYHKPKTPLNRIASQSKTLKRTKPCRVNSQSVAPEPFSKRPVSITFSASDRRSPKRMLIDVHRSPVLKSISASKRRPILICVTLTSLSHPSLPIKKERSPHLKQ